METSIIVAIIAGFVSFIGLVITKEQKVSEFRQVWIDALRNDVAELMSAVNHFELAYMAFLWPSGSHSKKEALSKFSNIVYHKKIKLSPQGGLNLLIELYKHMDWVGDKGNGFKGVKQKLIECFPFFEELDAEFIDEFIWLCNPPKN